MVKPKTSRSYGAGTNEDSAGGYKAQLVLNLESASNRLGRVCG